MQRQITIHLYRDGEYDRAISLGMKKVGLPDLYVSEISGSNHGSVGSLVNALAQVLAEGATPRDKGELLLDLHAIRNPEVRQSFLSSMKPNGTGKARLILLKGVPEEGDPDNRLVQIDSGAYPGNDASARQDALVAQLFGWEDAISYPGHNAELLAVSQRQREKLPALRERFNSGLEPSETLLLKAPFKAPDGGTEWMWVEVVSWKGDTVRGTLQNHPFRVPGLESGQEVEISAQDVFDYIHVLPDGTQDGNETGKMMEAAEKRKKGS